MNLNRREFLRLSAAAALAPVTGAAAPLATVERRNGMPYRELGATGERVSLLCLGGYHIGVDRLTDDESIRLMRHEPPYAPHIEEAFDIPVELDEDVVERPQEKIPLLPIAERLKGFPEVEQVYSSEQALSEACRCLRCDVQIEEEVEEPLQPKSLAAS